MPTNGYRRWTRQTIDDKNKVDSLDWLILNVEQIKGW
jgi:hypothetical protein